MSEKINGKYLFSFLSILTLVAYGFFVQAAFPTTQYNPGETLDPSDPACIPNATNCSVAVPFLTDQVNGYVYSNNSLHNKAFIFGDNDTTWTTGEESKMIFDRVNQAVRIGSINDTKWDPVNNGAKSVAIGFAVPGFFTGPQASGSVSFAYGPSATASGILSIAFGAGTTASALNAAAFGGGATASGASSLAFRGGNASGTNAIAFGGGATSSGNNSIAFFGGASASSALSFYGTASAVNAIAFGQSSIASGAQAIAFGNNTSAMASDSIAIGSNSTASGSSSFAAIGGAAANPDSVAIGRGSSAFGDGTIAIGSLAGGNTALTLSSIFIGPSAGFDATNADGSIFIGNGAGLNAQTATGSIFIGPNAGLNALTAHNSMFFGVNAGNAASGSDDSNFFGPGAGQDAAAAVNSNFFGGAAGQDADNAEVANFFGYHAGYHATNAAYGIFIGNSAGAGAINAKHAIFIGDNAGIAATVDNTVSGSSIAIGDGATPGSHKNSIAFGAGAANTQENQLMIGGGVNPINTLVLTGSLGNSCTMDVTISSPSCTSDARLKTNITDLDTDTLDKVMKVRTVNFNWINYPDAPAQIGFLAQDIQQQFPQVVSVAPSGYLTVSYGEMAPVLVEAVRELNMKLDNIDLEASRIVTNQSLLSGLVVWFANTANGIGDFFSKTSHTEKLCVGTTGNETCITKTELDTLLSNGSINNTGDVPMPNPAPAPDPIPLSDPMPVPDPAPQVVPAPDPVPDPASADVPVVQ